MDLYHAARRGDLDRVKFLVEHEAVDKDNPADIANMRTPLHAASNEGHLQVVRYLVEQGANKDKINVNGESPLAMASFNGHLEIVKYLIEQGCSIEKVDNDGWTPLNSGVLNGQIEVVRYLLEQGADRDKGNVEGGTPLHHAAHMGYLDILLFLMSYGADLNARSSDGQLPIDLALREEIRQAIRDEPRRRLDHGHKRATEQDWHPNAATSDTSQNGDKEERLANLFERLTCTTQLRLLSSNEEGKQEEDSDDSETSDDEDD